MPALWVASWTNENGTDISTGPKSIPIGTVPFLERHWIRVPWELDVNEESDLDAVRSGRQKVMNWRNSIFVGGDDG